MTDDAVLIEAIRFIGSADMAGPNNTCRWTPPTAAADGGRSAWGWHFFCNDD